MRTVSPLSLTDEDIELIQNSLVNANEDDRGVLNESLDDLMEDEKEDLRKDIRQRSALIAKLQGMYSSC